MLVFVARRISLAILVIAGVIMVTFAVAHVVPGDPAATWAGPHATAAQIAQARTFLGLNRPLPVQLVSYLGGIASTSAVTTSSSVAGAAVAISDSTGR